MFPYYLLSFMTVVSKKLFLCVMFRFSRIFFSCSTAVSGAHNTIVTARAGKDLISCLVSGLLTIVSITMENIHLHLTTSNKQRLWSAFDDIDPRLSLLCQVGDDVICPCR